MSAILVNIPPAILNTDAPNDSPIAKALLGHKVDDIVKLTTPGGDMEVRIVSIKTAK